MNKSIIELLADNAANQDDLALLFRVVAERIRSRLSPDDARIVAVWFERMANGEDPSSVLAPKRAGRPKGSTNKRGLMPDGSVPDDIDVAWIVRQNRDQGVKAGVVYAKVGRALGIPSGTVRNIYRRNKDKLG